MIVRVRVTPNSKAPSVQRAEGGVIKVKVTAKPVSGQANSAVIAALAEYFGVRKSAISIIKGSADRDKTVEIRDVV